jgi:RimJ/RimL family protein N-acetyltransferase
MQVLETERLTLRQLELGDAAFILELLNEPAFIENIADKGVRSLDDARAYLASGPLASYARHGFGLWLVALKETGTPVGFCGLIQREGLDSPDVGYAFLARHWSRGYAVEAASATVAYGFSELGLDRIVAITAPDNRRSIQVLERIGLRFEKMIELPQHGGASRLFSVDAKGRSSNHGCQEGGYKQPGDAR